MGIPVLAPMETKEEWRAFGVGWLVNVMKPLTARSRYYQDEPPHHDVDWKTQGLWSGHRILHDAEVGRKWSRYILDIPTPNCRAVQQ